MRFGQYGRRGRLDRLSGFCGVVNDKERVWRLCIAGALERSRRSCGLSGEYYGLNSQGMGEERIQREQGQKEKKVRTAGSLQNDVSRRGSAPQGPVQRGVSRIRRSQ